MKHDTNIVHILQTNKDFAKKIYKMKTEIDKSSVLERVKQALNVSSDIALAEVLGIARSTLSNWRSRGSIDYDLLFSKCKHINLDWLLTGHGSMQRCDVTQLAELDVAEQFPLRTDHNVDLQSVPLYELDAAAGLVALFADVTRPTPVSHLQIPNLPPCDGALYVHGDSMYPLLKSGDIVLYKEISNANGCLLWGEMYLLSFSLDGDDYITVKYVQKSDLDGYVRLVSHNPHHSPQDIPRDSIRALALVKASVRFNTMG